jgi:hypothetical protein
MITDRCGIILCIVVGVMLVAEYYIRLIWYHNQPWMVE